MTVTLLMPGPTATNIFRRGHLQDTLLGRAPKDDPAAVARQAYDALMAGDKRIVAASFLTRAVDLTNKMLPDVVKARIGRGVSAPGAGHDKEKT